MMYNVSYAVPCAKLHAKSKVTATGLETRTT